MPPPVRDCVLLSAVIDFFLGSDIQLANGFSLKLERGQLSGYGRNDVNPNGN